MRQPRKPIRTSAIILIIGMTLTVGCSSDDISNTNDNNLSEKDTTIGQSEDTENQSVTEQDITNSDNEHPADASNLTENNQDQTNEDDSNVLEEVDQNTTEQPSDTEEIKDIPVVANYSSTEVLVNKNRSLPADYVPDDLVQPNVPFSFEEQLEKKLMREEAAQALEALFNAAKEEEIELVAISGYRSYNTQQSIYTWNVNTYGSEHANQFSAYPGTSEHQTGLAMDISSASADYALEEHFGDTSEGQWLAENAAEYGFIIRYEEGKEEVTGYAYEPWHVRYVGVDIATSIKESEVTLEEYFAEEMNATIHDSEDEK
ncbi:M15 family metallopeptidase [Longirhabdus pacifica]|uniref:M15 family metallopeptidase n=1 Tax=Longirhabdus pacifica TaxID=2305227 RepID=UPI001F0CBBD0|nr:M15 family metallopeptidase [Longirhabdus pacifica]